MKKVVMHNNVLLPEVARLVALGEDVTMCVKGTSMLPFIRGGRDSVTLTAVDEIRDYDIVLAEVADGVYVLHRVVGTDGDKVILMGDGNICGREMCRRDKVMAKAIRIIRDGKTVDCMSAKHLRAAKLWRRLLPLRRYILAIYRRLNHTNHEN
ncbi:MAG: hypothetical protein E7124_03880 [Bacteroidales bacterium]|nr:hypothetical protein [Bacteroidales bacterium]MBQ8483016.1 S24/S26 family peptidase [Bacteroidales bacterium]